MAKAILVIGVTLVGGIVTTPMTAQVQLPSVNLGDTNFEDRFAGPDSRRFGHRNHLVFSILLYAIGAFGCFLSDELWMLLLATTVMGFGGGAAAGPRQNAKTLTAAKKLNIREKPRLVNTQARLLAFIDLFWASQILGFSEWFSS